MQAFILAGGFATRLWPLTEKRAKPLLPLAGKPLLTHLVEKIPEGMPVTVSTNAVFAKDFASWKSEIRNLKSEANPKHEIRILIEDTGHEDEKLGALGAVAKWITEEKIDDDVLLLAGDNYIGFSIAEFLQAYTGNPLLAAYDVHDLEKAKRLGTIVTDVPFPHPPTPSPTGGRGEEKQTTKHIHSLPPTGEGLGMGEKEEKKQVIRSFEEKSPSPRSTLVSTGCFVFPASVLPTLVSFAKEKPDNIGGIFEHFLKRGTPVECIAFTEPWFDIGSFEAYLEATKALVGNAVLAGQGHGQGHGNIFEGSVVLGKNSKVERSTIRNVVLFEDCDITDCILENCILDNRCVLRGVDLSGKMLREGTTLVRKSEARNPKSETNAKYE